MCGSDTLVRRLLILTMGLTLGLILNLTSTLRTMPGSQRRPPKTEVNLESVGQECPTHTALTASL